MPNPRNSKLDPHAAQIAEARARGETVAAIARSLGVARTTLNSWLDSESGRTSFDGADMPSREEMLEDEVRRLKATGRRDTKTAVAQERILRSIDEALGRTQPSGYLPYELPKRHSGAADHRQAVILSDWHGGEVVDAAQVGGLNEFNWEVLERRVDDTAAALLSFKQHRPELTGLDLWVLGDMVSGDIHEELTATNEFPVAEQCVRVGQLLASFIAKLAPHYPELYIPCIVGNHARTKKDHASKNVYDSWDWVAYELAAALTSRLPNVTWDIPRAGMIVRKIAGMNFLLWHGDGVRSSMPGVPAGGVTRRTNELRKQYGAQGIHLDGFACGHFHASNMWAGNVFINGSLIGTNEYGLKNYGGGEPPKQLLLTFHEKKQRITDVAFLTPR